MTFLLHFPHLSPRPRRISLDPCSSTRRWGRTRWRWRWKWPRRRWSGPAFSGCRTADRSSSLRSSHPTRCTCRLNIVTSIYIIFLIIICIVELLGFMSWYFFRKRPENWRKKVPKTPTCSEIVCKSRFFFFGALLNILRWTHLSR